MRDSRILGRDWSELPAGDPSETEGLMGDMLPGCGSEGLGVLMGK